MIKDHKGPLVQILMKQLTQAPIHLRSRVQIVQKRGPKAVLVVT